MSALPRPRLSKVLFSATLVAGSLLALAIASDASAADTIYWTNYSAAAIRHGNLDGSGSATSLFSSEGNAFGIALNPATGKIYWARQDSQVRVGNLDGSGTAADLWSSEAAPTSLATDPANNKIYWGNFATPFTLRKGNLDGTGSASDVGFPGEAGQAGVAIDPANNKIYWSASGKIRKGNLDGTGTASDLWTGESSPSGIAIDPPNNKIYWAATSGATLRQANLDGTGTVSDLWPVVSSDPEGVAIDPADNKIYWTNYSGTVKRANLDGSGSITTLFPSEASGLFDIAVLVAPLGTGVPQISGGGQVGQQLSCSQGSWAADLVGAFFYRAPATFAYQWQLGGVDIGGATSSTFTPGSAGNYSCRVTATNQAGSAPQTSGQTSVVNPPPPSGGSTTMTPAPAVTGLRAAALKKCKKKHGRARANCKKKANKLPV
jgi:DNA-binding beta-propeller fold protein YncE